MWCCCLQLNWYLPDLYREVENKNSSILEKIFFKLDLRGYKETRSIFQTHELEIVHLVILCIWIVI